MLLSGSRILLEPAMKHPFTSALAALAAVLTLTQCGTPAGMVGGGRPPPASKESPFVNSLGMKFVPVPGTNVLFCTTETTRDQYLQCGRGYQAPDFAQDGSHPAVNVSWEDAKAFCAWLSRKEGLRYRLPTSYEWNFAVGAAKYPWGNQWPPPPNAGNYMGQEARTAHMKQLLVGQGKTSAKVLSDYQDRHVFTAPVASYRANELGIYDLGGNVYEWVSDHRMLKGHSWYGGEAKFLTSSDVWVPVIAKDDNFGFRVVLVR